MATALRPSHQAERYSHDTRPISQLTTICRVFSTRSTRALRILWLDRADAEDIRIHGPANSWIGCCGGKSVSSQAIRHTQLSSAAARVFQNVFLSILFMLSFCYHSLNAYQLDGMWWYVTGSRIQLTAISTISELVGVRTTTTVIGPNGHLRSTKILLTVTGLT